MSSSNRDHQLITADIGWRVSRLRVRHGLSQHEVARRTGKHTSFLSRLERPESREGVPKRETVEAILDAIGASPEERAAVFQVETAAPTTEEIQKGIEIAKARYEHSDQMVILLDSRWFRWYMNPRFCRLFEITPEEYERAFGENVLTSIIDPASPLYSRCPDADRAQAFSLRAAAFQLKFAEHQFDSWYLDLEQRITRIPYAEHLWYSLPVTPDFGDRLELPMQRPDGTFLCIAGQQRQLYNAPRFTLVELGPADEATANEISRLLGA
jgi:transcriptional regulator with XRE-family HTH domain